MPAIFLSAAAMAVVFASPRRHAGVRLFCLVSALMSLYAPVVLAPAGPVRTILGFAMCMVVFRTIQMIREEHALTFRVLSTLLLVDPRAQSATFHGKGALVLRTFLFGLVSAISAFYTQKAPLVCGVLFVASGASATDGFTRLVAGMFGDQWGALHDDPWMSRSLSEFWGTRWNRVVSHWLRVHVFLPIHIRFGPIAGVFGTFAVSALLHFYPVYISTDLRNASMMGSYFLLQAIFVLVEKRLPRGAWNRPFAYLAVLGPIPLFVFPILRALRLIAF